MEFGFECVACILLVSVVWGATNPLMRLGSKHKKEAATENVAWYLRPLVHLVALACNWRFTVPFLVNQTASIMFTGLVSKFPVSVVVPAVNSLQFVVAAIVGSFFGEKLNGRGWLGCLMVMVGVGFMIVADLH